MTVTKIIILCLLSFTGFAQANAETDVQRQDDQLKLGLELISQKKFKNAEKHFTQLKQLHPKQITYMNNLAVAQMAQGKTELALNNLKSALVADKYYSITQKNVSNIYAYMASKAYSKALDKTQQPNKLPELSAITEIKPLLEEIIVPVVQKIADKPELVSKQKTEADLKRLFENKMAVWAKAWMKGDSKTYIASYSTKFDPAGKLTHKDWIALRKYRLRHSKQVKVSYNQLTMFLNADKDTAIVEFVQNYKAGKYNDRVRKQLYWQLEGDNWLITREQVTEKIK